MPFLLMLPISLIQESVTFSLGQLTPGGDAAHVVAWGVPSALLIIMGALFLAGGIGLLAFLLPIAGVSREARFGSRWGIVTAGMITFMLVRLIATAILRTENLLEGLIPLVFSLLLSLAAAAVFGPIQRRFGRLLDPVRPHTFSAAAMSLTLGVGMIVLQLAMLNPA